VAVHLADTSGDLRMASMRAVAAQLDTGVASLYRYVSTRDELLDLMVDRAFGDLDLGTFTPTGDWRVDLREVGRRLLAVFRRHPWLSSVPGVIHLIGPHIAGYLDAGLGVVSGLPGSGRSKLEAIALMAGVLSLFDRHVAADAPAYRMDSSAFGMPHLAAVIGEVAADPPPAEASQLTDHLLDLAVRVVGGILQV